MVSELRKDVRTELVRRLHLTRDAVIVGVAKELQLEGETVSDVEQIVAEEIDSVEKFLERA